MTLEELQQKCEEYQQEYSQVESAILIGNLIKSEARV